MEPLGLSNMLGTQDDRVHAEASPLLRSRLQEVSLTATHALSCICTFHVARSWANPPLFCRRSVRYTLGLAFVSFIAYVLMKKRMCCSHLRADA